MVGVLGSRKTQSVSIHPKIQPRIGIFGEIAKRFQLSHPHQRRVRLQQSRFLCPFLVGLRFGRRLRFDRLGGDLLADPLGFRFRFGFATGRIDPRLRLDLLSLRAASALPPIALRYFVPPPKRDS